MYYAEFDDEDDEPLRKTKKQYKKKDDSPLKECFTMKCEKCTVTFESFKEVKSHYEKKHQTIGYLVCCKEKFKRRVRALEHAARHQNPKYM